MRSLCANERRLSRCGRLAHVCQQSDARLRAIAYGLFLRSTCPARIVRVYVSEQVMTHGRRLKPEMIRELSKAKQCRRFIEGIPLPTHQQGKCRGMPSFFACVEPGLRTACGDSGVSVVVDAIGAFGCLLERGIAPSRENFLVVFQR